MPGISIYWEDLRIGYNRIFKTNHKTVKDLVLKMYKEHKSLHKCADILGVSRAAFSNKLKYFNLSLNKKGGDNNPGVKKALFLAISPERMKMMTILQVSKACNFTTSSYIYKLKKRYNRKTRRVLNNGRSYI